MLGTVLLAIVTALPEPAAVGQVSATVGTVHIRRGGQSYRATPRSAIQAGDVLSTGDVGGLGVLTYDGQVIYVGPATSVTLSDPAGGRTLELGRGEVRATVAGDNALSVKTPVALARIAHGTLSVAATPQESRLLAEAGSADVRAGDRGAEPLAAGKQMTVTAAGEARGPEPADGRGWAIRVDQLQLASAAASSRLRKGTQAVAVNEATAVALARPSGQAGEIPTTPPAEAAQPPEAPQPQPTTDAAQPQPQPQPDATQEADQPVVNSQPNTSSTSLISLALGNFSGASASGASGGLFSDAQQDTLNPAFPGNIFLVTAQTSYTLQSVALRQRDLFPTTREYWSIGLGTPPTQQVVTTFRTASDRIPETIRIPRFDGYLVRFPQSQFGIPDPVDPDSGSSILGIAGLLGSPPTAPGVRGATPLTDPRAQFNDRATFALGEFALQREGTRPQIDVRRSDQDREIIKSPTGNDNLDRVTPNRSVVFEDVSDPRFFPEVPTVKVPVSVAGAPGVRGLDSIRRAALTTLLADRLSDYARRTGQTRFVLDGQIVDISGYHRPGGAGLMRADLVRPGINSRPAIPRVTPRN